MSLPLDPIPQTDPLIDANDRMNDRWYRWLANFVSRVTTGSTLAGHVDRVGIGASLAATTLSTPTQSGLVFRISWRARITTAAGTNSSLTVTLSWKEGGVACSRAFAAITGNTTATTGGEQIPIRPDSGQPIQYATTYASAGVPAMVHDLSLTSEDIT